MAYKQVAQICAIVLSTAGAVAPLYQWPLIGAIAALPDLFGAGRSKCGAIATHSRWGDAVEQIYSATHALDEVIWEANAH